MKTTTKLIIAALTTVIGWTGCQDVHFKEDLRTDQLYAFIETFDPETKAELNDKNKIVWTEGDEIAVYSKDGCNIYEIEEEFIGTSSGYFRYYYDEVLDYEPALTQTVAIYPTTVNTYKVTETEDGKILINQYLFGPDQVISEWVPAIQHNMIAVSSNMDNGFAFKNIGGIIKLSIKGDIKVSRIEIRGNSDEILAGSGTLTVGDDMIPSLSDMDYGSEFISTRCVSDVNLNLEEATDFYLYLLPTEFENGFTVTIWDSEGNEFVKTTTKRQSVKRSGMLSMPTFTIGVNPETEGYYPIENVQSYDNVSGDVVASYNASNPPAPGQAFVLPAEYGYGIRVIEDYNTISDNRIRLNTTTGNICNLFKNYSFTLATSESIETRGFDDDVITPSAIGYLDSEGTYHEVYNINNATKASYPIDQELFKFEQDYSDTEINEFLRLKEYVLNAGLNGTFTFDFGEKKINEVRSIGDLKSFEYEIKGNLDFNILLECSVESNYKQELNEIIKKDAIKAKVLKFVVGGVPVILTVHTNIGKHSLFTANGTATASAGYGFNAEISGGVLWTPESGATPYYSAKSQFSNPILSLNTEATVEAKVSYYPQIEMKLYNFIGPCVELRPYIKESIKAGAGVLSQDGSYIGWTAGTYSGMDLRLGLNMGFGGFSEELVGTDLINLVEDTPLFEAPYRISIKYPEEEIFNEGETINAEFLVESYSPLIDQYFPCPWALVRFETEDGTTASEVALSDINGSVTCEWIPSLNEDGKAELTAKIVNGTGDEISHCSLLVMPDNLEKWIDLGLSVLWAAYNVGANSPEDYGGYYAWGGEDIAQVKWGGGARMPTLDNIKELVNKCSFTTGTYNGIRGNYVSGPNGNSIFLPFAGYVSSYGSRDKGEVGYFWSSTNNDLSYLGAMGAIGIEYNNPYFLECDIDGGRWWSCDWPVSGTGPLPDLYVKHYFRNGSSVRPVKNK